MEGKTNFISMLKESKSTMEVYALSIRHFQLCIVEEDTMEGETLGQKEFHRCQGSNHDKCKMCLGVWFHKFVVLRLLSSCIFV